MYIYIPPKVTLTIYFSDHKLRIHSNYHWQFDIPEHESFTLYHWKHKMNACSIFLQSLLEYQIQYCISSLTKASQRYFKNDMTCSLAIGYISSSPIVVGSTFTNRNIQFCFFTSFEVSKSPHLLFMIAPQATTITGSMKPRHAARPWCRSVWIFWRSLLLCRKPADVLAMANPKATRSCPCYKLLCKPHE